jgi:hypothetical protein
MGMHQPDASDNLKGFLKKVVLRKFLKSSLHFVAALFVQLLHFRLMTCCFDAQVDGIESLISKLTNLLTKLQVHSSSPNLFFSWSLWCWCIDFHSNYGILCLSTMFLMYLSKPCSFIKYIHPSVLLADCKRGIKSSYKSECHERSELVYFSRAKPYLKWVWTVLKILLYL